MRAATVFKRSLKTISNDLLNSILQVCKDQIRDDVQNVEYLVITSDETTDVFCKTVLSRSTSYSELDVAVLSLSERSGKSFL